VKHRRAHRRTGSGELSCRFEVEEPETGLQNGGDSSALALARLSTASRSTGRIIDVAYRSDHGFHVFSVDIRRLPAEPHVSSTSYGRS